MKKYKLTNQNLQTYNDFQWKIGVPKETDGNGELCSKGWLHYYHHPLLALLLNPIHADIKNPRLFEVKAEGIHKDDSGRKGGCTKMTLIKEIEIPQISLNQKVVFAILCALKFSKNADFKKWAENWLNNKDRTKHAADATAVAAADAAADAAAVAAVYAADAAANAAANAAAYAANATAVAAANAADAAVDAAADFNLIKIAKQAMKYK